MVLNPNPALFSHSFCITSCIRHHIAITLQQSSTSPALPHSSPLLPKQSTSTLRAFALPCRSESAIHQSRARFPHCNPRRRSWLPTTSRRCSHVHLRHGQLD